MSRLIVQIPFGKMRGRRRVLTPGDTLIAGRTEIADWVVAHDSQMSRTHFELSWDGSRCTLRDRKSQSGTYLDGERVADADVPHRGWIRAGTTDFMVFRELATAARDHEPLAEDRARNETVLEQLRTHVGQLYAVLDSARDNRVLELLDEAVDPHACLYDGAASEPLARVAPYVVRFAPDSELLAHLIREGWGRRWGIYLTSKAKLRDVRRHLRRFLMVREEHSQAELYFRFYDPPTLRTFLSVITPRQRSQWFADTVQAFHFEEPLRSVCSRATEPDGSLITAEADR